MADIQAEGLRAASELLDRVLARDAPVSPPPDGSSEEEYGSLLDAWASLLQRFADGLSRPGEEEVTSVRLDVDAVGPPVRIRWADGESSETELSLHNGAAAALGPLRLLCSQLTGPDGDPLEGAELRFEPLEIERLPARSSRSVTLSLRAQRRLRGGVYRGTVQAAGAPSLWLPVEVAVEPC